MELQDALYLLCDAPVGCFNATMNIRADYFCDAAFRNLTAAVPSYVCNGSCGALLDEIVTECGNVSVLMK